MTDIFEDQLLAAAYLLRDPTLLAREPREPEREPPFSPILATLKALHLHAIGEIIMIDTIHTKHREQQIDQGFIDHLGHIRHLWRRVSDSILWNLLSHQRHLVKRLCLYRPRGPLAEANPDHVLRALQVFNQDPSSIALWNDATSLADVGDLTVFSRDRGLHVVELKEGKVNEEILNLIEATPPDQRLSKIEEFAGRFGDSGLRQFERVLRQATRTQQVISLINDEKGVDPVTDLAIGIQELRTLDRFYDSELSWLLEEAIAGRRAVTSIDGCLWVYADGRRDVRSQEEIQGGFVEELTRRVPSLEGVLRESFAARDARRTVMLSQGVYCPVSKPLFVRDLTPQQVVAVVYGRLRTRVLLFLDWEAFGRLVHECGAEFAWSTEKEARKQKAVPSNRRPEVVRGRLPLVHAGPVKMTIMGANMVRIMFDGLRPRTLVEQQIESANILEERFGEKTG